MKHRFNEFVFSERESEMNASHEDTKSRRDKEALSKIVVDCAYRMHVEIGPGLLESVYEAVLEKLLLKQGLKVSRQQAIPIEVMGLSINEGFRADLIIEDILLIELKSVEKLAPVHSKQVLTYLRLLNLPLGLLINFGSATFREGCKRIVYGQQDFVPSCESESWERVVREGLGVRHHSKFVNSCFKAYSIWVYRRVRTQLPSRVRPHK